MILVAYPSSFIYGWLFFSWICSLFSTLWVEKSYLFWSLSGPGEDSISYFAIEFFTFSGDDIFVFALSFLGL